MEIKWFCREFREISNYLSSHSNVDFNRRSKSEFNWIQYQTQRSERSKGESVRRICSLKRQTLITNYKSGINTVIKQWKRFAGIGRQWWAVMGTEWAQNGHWMSTEKHSMLVKWHRLYPKLRPTINRNYMPFDESINTIAKTMLTQDCRHRADAEEDEEWD